jgi:hypothetical protein
MTREKILQIAQHCKSYEEMGKRMGPYSKQRAHQVVSSYGKGFIEEVRSAMVDNKTFGWRISLPPTPGIFCLHFGEGPRYYSFNSNMRAGAQIIISYLANKKHKNKQLMEAYKKYGQSALEFEIFDVSIKTRKEYLSKRREILSAIENKYNAKGIYTESEAVSRRYEQTIKHNTKYAARRSGHEGIYWHRSGYWYINLYVAKGRRVSLGYFKNKKDAVECVKQYRKKHGERSGQPYYSHSSSSSSSRRQHAK